MLIKPTNYAQPHGIIKCTCSSIQWRSQNTANARAQRGHITFASGLVPRPRPALIKPLAVWNAEETSGVWGMLPQKILEFLSFIDRFWGYFRPHRHLELEHFDHAFTTNIQIAILRSSISTPLCTFSTQFAIDNGTFSTDNFQERMHWWGTASGY